MAVPAVFSTTVGAEAVLVPASVPIPEVIEEEQDRVVDSIASPLQPVYDNAIGWSGGNRCTATTPLAVQFPLPNSYTVASSLDNNACAIRLLDGTIYESQPFTRCAASGPAYLFNGAAHVNYDEDETADDFTTQGPQDGARGGSGIPVWYTTVRVSEVAPGAAGGFLTHPMCWIVPPSWLSNDGDGFRWPAVRADADYLTDYTGSVTALKMGSLLTLPLDFDVNALTTDVGKWIARNLLSCGAYVGDIRIDSPETLGIAMEEGPAGVAQTEINTEFGMFLGCDSSPSTTDDQGLDMRAIIAELQVVNNNSFDYVGGVGPPSDPPEVEDTDIATLTYARTTTPKEVIKRNSVTISPSDPYSDSGMPGYLNWVVQKSYASPNPTCTIELNRIPETSPGVWAWSRGQSISIDAGYDGAPLVRIFTGFLFARGQENPDYLRTRTFVEGVTLVEGVDPDQTRRTLTSFATLTSTTLPQPPLPAGTYIDQEYSNPLLDTDAIVAEVAARLQTERGRVPRQPGVEVRTRTLTCLGTLYRLFRVPEVPERDFTGQTIEEGLGGLCDYVGITTRVIVAPAHTLGTNAPAVLSRARASQMAQYIMDIKGMKVSELNSGVPVFRVVTEQPAPTARWTYTSTDEDTARVIDGAGATVVRVPLNPNVELGDTFEFDVPEAQLVGRYFCTGVRHQGGPGGYLTDVTVVGGDEFGGNVSQNPIAIFSYRSIREVFGAQENVIASFDATASFDPDGTIVSYAWSDNQTTTPEISSFTGTTATVRGDTSGWTGSWDVTLTVTDNEGLEGSVTITIPYLNNDEDIIIPATYVAMSNNASASLDGDVTWNDQAGSTCISTGAKPADGSAAGVACFGFTNGVIKRTTDGCATALTTVYTLASGAAINYIAWDWRNTSRVWALSADMQLLWSQDGGVTWAVYNALRSTLSLAGAIAGRRCIGLPAGDGVYVFGGTGTGYPLIAFDPVVGSHGWVNQGLLGDIATDFPADSTCRIMDFTAPGYSTGTGVMILEFASGGGGSIQPIYSTISAPGITAAYTRATGLTAGLKTGKYIVGDNPISSPLFHAAFGDRHVWDSLDGIAWTQKSNVMPAGVTPNDAIFMSDVLTGIDGLFGVYMIAAENAGNTLGLYKSSDGITTVDTIRPSAAGDTWPAAAKGMQIAVGASGASAETGVQLARIALNGDVHVFDGSGAWTLLGTGTVADKAKCLMWLPGGEFYYIDADDAGNSGDLWHSPTGVSWTKILARTADRGVKGFDILANGDVMIAFVGPTGTSTQALSGLQLYRAVAGDYANPTLDYSDPGISARATDIINADGFGPIICDKWNANNIACLAPGSGASADSIYSTNGGSSFTQTDANTLPYHHSFPDHTGAQFLESGRILLVGHTDSTGDVVTSVSDDYTESWSPATAAPPGSIPDPTFGCIGPYKTDWLNKMVVATHPTSSTSSIYGCIAHGVGWTELVGGIAENIQSLEYDPGTDTAYYEVDAGGIFKVEGLFGGSPVTTDITFNLSGSSGIVLLNGLALAR